MLESISLFGGLLGAVALALLSLLPTNGGEPRPPLEVLIATPLVLLLVCAACLFLGSGIGWMSAGHGLIGAAVMLVRLYPAGFVYGYFLGSASDVDGRGALAMFIISMVYSAASVAALAHWTGRPSRGTAEFGEHSPRS